MKQSNNSFHSLDLVTLVNEHDEVVGKMDKVEAHRGQAQRHRAISVYLFRKKHSLPSLEGRTSSEALAEHDKWGGSVELLIQQRSAKKIVGAHQWANTVCGNVRPNETYEQCAYRRLKEELSIDLFSPPLSAVVPPCGTKEDEGSLPAQAGTPSPAFTGHGKKGAKSELSLIPIHKFEYHLQCNEEFSEWEIDQVFVGWYDGEIHPNPDEVQDYAWVDFNNLKLKADNAKLETKSFNTKHISLTTHLSQLEPENQNLKPSITLAPWFVYMLEDEELQEKLHRFTQTH